MTTASVAYGTSTAVTWTLTGLASSSTLLVGRQCTAVDNTSTLAVDYIFGGKTRASLVGTPIAGQFELWSFGSYDGTTYVGEAVMGATDAGVTLTAPGKPEGKLLFIQPTDTTASHVYSMGTFSIAQAFGGIVPKKWVAWCTHNMSAALSTAATDHEFKYTAINYTSV